jgi:hypothetical protein
MLLVLNRDKFDYDEQCEFQCDTCVDKKGVDYGYLPKEQQKQALIDMMKSDEELGLYGEVYSKQGIALTSDYIQNIEKEIKLEELFNDDKRENIKIFIDEIKNPSEPNQALKDAAERYIAGDNYNRYYDDFIDGAKWQQERMYSEEDMIDFAHFYFTEEFNSSMQTSKSTKDIFNEWFEQFKKK